MKYGETYIPSSGELPGVDESLTILDALAQIGVAVGLRHAT